MEEYKFVFPDQTEYNVSATSFNEDFFKGLEWYHSKEKELFNSLIATLIDLLYTKRAYEAKLNSYLKDGTEEFDHYKKELITTKVPFDKKYYLIFRKTELNFHFKTFLLLVKSVLDKSVSLFDYRYRSNLRKFSRNGNALVRYLKNNEKNQEGFADFISENSVQWISSLIELRDKYVHFTDLPEYVDFCYVMTEASSPPENLNDFQQPTINTSKGIYYALQYMADTYSHLGTFVNKFLTYSGYTSYKKPPIRSRCDCGFQFGKLSPDKKKLHIEKVFGIEVQIKELKLGLLHCPDCKKQYDTDLEFWTKYGLRTN